MAKTVFIAGSIKIKHLHPLVKERLDRIVTSDLDVVVGDAEGADSSIQSYLFEKGARATVYCTGPRPRNNVGGWPIQSIQATAKPGTRAYFTVKDVAMAEVANFGLMIWDTQSTGTLSNVIELLKRKKKTLVFLNKEKEFLEISNVWGLEALIRHMSEGAKRKADEKIHLTRVLQVLKKNFADAVEKSRPGEQGQGEMPLAEVSALPSDQASSKRPRESERQSLGLLPESDAQLSLIPPIAELVHSQNGAQRKRRTRLSHKTKR